MHLCFVHTVYLCFAHTVYLFTNKIYLYSVDTMFFCFVHKVHLCCIHTINWCLFYRMYFMFCPHRVFLSTECVNVLTLNMFMFCLHTMNLSFSHIIYSCLSTECTYILSKNCIYGLSTRCTYVLTTKYIYVLFY